MTDELFCFFNGFSAWESSVIWAGELTVSETHAIEVLGQYGQMNMKSVALKLGVTTGTVTVTVDRLEKKQYAKRELSAKDRRVYLINLTEKGQKAYEEHHQYHTELSRQIMGVLDEEEGKQFLLALQKINKEIF